MRAAYFAFAITFILDVFLLIIQPWLSRKNVLFGVVFDNDEIWTNKAAHKIRTIYLAVMIVGAITISIFGISYFARL